MQLSVLPNRRIEEPYAFDAFFDYIVIPNYVRAKRLHILVIEAEVYASCHGSRSKKIHNYEHHHDQRGVEKYERACEKSPRPAVSSAEKIPYVH